LRARVPKWKIAWTRKLRKAFSRVIPIPALCFAKNGASPVQLVSAKSKSKGSTRPPGRFGHQPKGFFAAHPVPHLFLGGHVLVGAELLV